VPCAKHMPSASESRCRYIIYPPSLSQSMNERPCKPCLALRRHTATNRDFGARREAMSSREATERLDAVVQPEVAERRR